jgi:hypothetical protein
MKTTLITLLAVFLSSTLFATELEWVDEQIEAIKPPRKGVSISGVGDPFIFLEKNKPKSKEKGAASSSPGVKVTAKPSVLKQKVCPPDGNTTKSGNFDLSVIINSKAMINGSWYKKSDTISSYTVSDVSKNSVTLKKGDKELILSTSSKKQTLKFKNK